MGEKFVAKVKQDDDLDYFIKIPKYLVDQLKLKKDSYVDFSLDIPKEFVVEVNKAVIDEIHNMKEKWPMYKDKDESEILKDIMLKFNKKDSEDLNTNNKPLKIIEKGTL